MNTRMKQLFFFTMLYFKGWTPRNTNVMEKELEFAVHAFIAMSEG